MRLRIGFPRDPRQPLLGAGRLRIQQMRLPRPDATTRYDRRLALPTMAATTIVISMNLDERATTGMTDGVLDRDRSDRFSRLVRRNVTLAGAVEQIAGM